MDTTYKRYCEALLTNGFTEAKQEKGHFYRHSTAQTAFIINLHDGEFFVDILYGFASTANEEWFIENGAHSDTCQIRQILSICEKNDEIPVAQTIKKFYEKYKNYSKDEILSLKKELQKGFLDRFTHILKPLGFKKKGAKWSKELENNHLLTLDAQKSAYSDQYYFNISVHPITVPYLGCFNTRVVMFDSDIYNWQLMSDEQIDNLINFTMEHYITPILKMPLIELGKTDFICERCACTRNKCHACWVQRNLWGN